MKNYHSLSAVQQDLYTGTLTCEALSQHYIAQTKAQQSLNAFVEVYEDRLIATAKEVDEKIAQGRAGKLAGLVLGLKDLICLSDHGLNASSRILGGFKSLITSTAVERLLDEDAIIIGRQNCDEFAMGSSNENSFFGPVANPIDPTRVPGGSSGGSASAVKAEMCLASLGSDTGGSVRQPASFCGIVGVKPTYGRVSRWGLIAYASSFDQIGPLTHTVDDAATILQIMAGHDPKDNTSSQHPVDDYRAIMAEHQGAKFRIGIFEEVLESPGLDPQIKAHTEELLAFLKQQGHEIVPLHFPYLDYVVPCYYILTTAESSSNLSRFDGVRYGYRSEQAGSLEELYLNSRSEGFGTEVKRRIVMGSFVLSAGYFDAYYTKAMKVRRLVQQRTMEFFKECDFMLMPTAPSTAFKLGEKTDDPIEMYLSDIFTVHASLAGIPAISVPTGTHDNGMPIGTQLLAPAFGEGKMFAMAKQMGAIYQQV